MHTLNMSAYDEDEVLRHNVVYLRYLLESGLGWYEISRIAKERDPKLEVCFDERQCMLKAKNLEHGKYVVLISYLRNSSLLLASR